MRTSLKNYALIGVTLLASWLVSKGAVKLLHSSVVGSSEHAGLPVFVDIVFVMTLGFIAYEVAKPTIIPSFVLAILFGFLSKDLLVFITQDTTSLSILVTVGATLILFGGGLDTPFTNFRKLVGPILSLAFIGTLLTAFLFSLLLTLVAQIFDLHVPLAAIVILGTALASTDPASIIPCFKSLSFTHPRVKHIAVSESALNDVIGALLTGLFIFIFTSNTEVPLSLIEAYRSVVSPERLLNIAQLVGVGVGVGLLGYFALAMWSKWKEKNESEGEADSAFFLAIPIFALALASALGGSGFLAVFIAGLLFQLRSHFHYVEHFFNHTIEGFMKPLIFMLLGTMVNINELWSVAPVGVVIGVLFIFVIRPIVVFVTLGPFMGGRHKFSFKELLFLSCIRETGVIPAVLLVSMRIAGVPGADIAIAIGMWVILLTLIFEPALTPFIARKLSIAKPFPKLSLPQHRGPVAVLCSRGFSFVRRLDAVADWCSKHNTNNVMLLHCPEDKYSQDFIQEVAEKAQKKILEINEQLAKEEREEINFSIVSRQGSLVDNIESLIEGNEVSIMFVGRKMLDFKLEQIKKLKVPFFFIN